MVFHSCSVSHRIRFSAREGKISQSVEQGSVEHFAKTKAHRIAIYDGEHHLTWQQLDNAADRFANSMARHGLGGDDRIAVRMHTRYEWFIVNLAIGKLGATQIAVNWKLTPVEIRYIVEDSRATAIIYDDEDPSLLSQAWADLDLKLMVSLVPDSNSLVVDMSTMLAEGDEAHIDAVSPARIVLYTSGTTGKPKGAVADPLKLAARAAEVMEYLASVGGVAPRLRDTKALVALPMHHGAGPAAAAQALSVGGEVHLMRHYDPVKALELISRHGITHWIAVPTMLNRIAALPADIFDKYDVSSLKFLNLGAAAVPFALKQWIVEHFGDHCLYEGYGSTETGMITYMTPQDQLRKPGSSGMPYRHVSIRILDDEGGELPIGETGEIWVNTPVAIDRYLNRAALDEETLSGDGYFRVGDVGHVDDEGYLFITDRRKDMIVAGGVNIYPAEIEGVLIRHPNVIEAAVIGIPDDDFGEQVMAYCEVIASSGLDAKQLIEFCATELAGYKLPRRIEFVSELPRNPMGKVLKKELREPFWKDRERKV